MFIFFSHLKLAFFNFRKFRKLKDIFKTFLNWTLPTVQRISFWLFSVPLTATLWKDKWLGIFINAFCHHSQGSIRLGPSLCPSSRNLLMSQYNSQGNDSNPPLTFPHWHKFMYSQCYIRNKHKRFPPWKKQAKWFGAARDEYLQINHRSKKKNLENWHLLSAFYMPNTTRSLIYVIFD